VFLTEFVFGKNCKYFKYLHRCFQNIGICYHHLGKTEERQNAYNKADEFEKSYVQ